MDNKLTATDYKKKNTRERRKKEKNYDNHLKELWNELKDKYPCPVIPRDKDREYAEDDDPVYYEREYRSQDSKQLKKQYNRKIRNTDDEELFRNGEYKKNGDFWWDYC